MIRVSVRLIKTSTGYTIVPNEQVHPYLTMKSSDGLSLFTIALSNRIAKRVESVIEQHRSELKRRLNIPDNATEIPPSMRVKAMAIDEGFLGSLELVFCPIGVDDAERLKVWFHMSSINGPQFIEIGTLADAVTSTPVLPTQLSSFSTDYDEYPDDPPF